MQSLLLHLVQPADSRLKTTGKTMISVTYDRKAIRELAGRVLEAFPSGLEYTVHAMTAQDDNLAVAGIGDGGLNPRQRAVYNRGNDDELR